MLLQEAYNTLQSYQGIIQDSQRALETSHMASNEIVWDGKKSNSVREPMIRPEHKGIAWMKDFGRKI